MIQTLGKKTWLKCNGKEEDRISRNRRKRTWIKVENTLGSTSDYGVKFWLNNRILVEFPDLANINIGYPVGF